MFQKIRTKILLPTLVVFCIALALIGGVSAFLTYTSTLKTLTQTMTEIISVASSQVTAEVTNYQTLMVELSGSVKFLASDKVMGFLESSRSRHGFENISITSPDGIVGGTKSSVAEYDFFKVPRDQHIPYISEPIANADGKSMTFYVAAPVMVGSRFDGIIFTGIDAKMLTDIVADIAIGETGDATIIDKTGTTIAFHDYNMVLSAYRTQDEEKKDPQLATLAALEREVMAGNTGFRSYRYGSSNKIMAYAPIAGTNNWGMYVTVAQSEFMQGAYTSMIVCGVLTIVSLVVAGFVLAVLAGSISRPIISVAQAATQMAKGHFEVEITHVSNDEIGSLADSMRQMKATTNEIILDTSRGLGEIANGNFDVMPQANYIGVFKGIETAMFRIITDLSETMSQIKSSAEQVSTGSEQVSNGAQALAQGATEQASSVQELSATINEVSGQINDNAANAAAASKIAHSVGESIQTSNVQMTKMMDAITEISSSSSQISKIIKTIEDIAFQTNILALNAAVEAARAGAAGKGFAVVADEVRNLATKSSQAAQQTNVLIENSVKSVDSGVKIANETAKSLLAVVSGAEETIGLISKISQASAEQSNSIVQINLGVEQISSVVQTNSATSEESAAASEELNGQANMMKQLVAKFKLNSYALQPDSNQPQMRSTQEVNPSFANTEKY